MGSIGRRVQRKLLEAVADLGCHRGLATEVDIELQFELAVFPVVFIKL